jgi:hypothetical protein
VCQVRPTVAEFLVHHFEVGGARCEWRYMTMGGYEYMC